MRMKLFWSKIFCHPIQKYLFNGLEYLLVFKGDYYEYELVKHYKVNEKMITRNLNSEYENSLMI